MSPIAILYPVFALVALSFIVLFYMSYRRLTAIALGKVKMTEHGEHNWDNHPPVIVNGANHYQNLFEMPVLFYALVGFLLITKQVDLVFVALAWAFVTFRYIHAYVHTQVSGVPIRSVFFALGALTIMIMWIIFAVRIAQSGL